MRHFLLTLALFAMTGLGFGPASFAQDEAEAEPAMTENTEVAAEPPAESGPTIAREAIIIDYETGMVLLEKNPDQKMPTSSMSKVMTAYVVFDALKNGKLTLDSKLPVSEHAWSTQGSKMFVEVGNSIPVEDLIRGVIIQSGNDATIVLAEGVAGTEADFADLMNAKAKELGMSNSHFVNASGWPDPEHYSTARDLATLAVHLIREFPDEYKYYSEKEFTYHNIRQMNRNPLLYRNMGVDGIKTGHTEIAGYGLMASGVRDGRRVIMVVNGLKDEKERAQESARLMEWALRSFENVKLFSAGDTVEQAYVAMGQASQVPLVVTEDITVTLPKAVKNDLKVTAVYNEPIVAPIKKGDKVGTLKVDVPRVGVTEYDLVAGADVAELGLFAATMTKAKMLLGAKISETTAQ